MWNKKGVSATIVYIPKFIIDGSSEKTSTNLVEWCYEMKILGKLNFYVVFSVLLHKI